MPALLQPPRMLHDLDQQDHGLACALVFAEGANPAKAASRPAFSHELTRQNDVAFESFAAAALILGCTQLL
jgi:hypothetical protein